MTTPHEMAALDPPSSPERTRVQLALGFGLSWAAGFIDVVGYLVLFHVFVANMTGNTIALGSGGADAGWRVALRRGWAIPCFVFGNWISRVLIHVGRERRWRRVYVALHLVQVVLLAAAVALASQERVNGSLAPSSEWPYYVLIGCLALAMGIQNAAMRHFGDLTIYTTYVSGTLAKFADECAKFTAWWIRGASDDRAAWRRQQSLRDAGLLGTVWCCYLAGAGIGSVCEHVWKLSAVLIPMVFLLGMIVVELRQPHVWDPAR